MSMADDLAMLLSRVAEEGRKVIVRDLRKKIHGMLKTLTSLDARILRKRFNLEEGAYEVTNANAEPEMTKEDIAQIEIRALRKLRYPNESKMLRSFIEEDQSS